jgi:MbtH protein
MSWESEDTVFMVVINDEEQYSLWPEYRALPAGWRDAGKRGDKSSCLQFIEQNWTDMRPRSLRIALDQQPAAEKAEVTS